MSYLSLYRKYRPQTFEDVVGQEPVVRTLRNALQRGRVAHAYMFSGPRGTGKTSLARLLAKGLNCRQGPTAEPCNVCSNCQLISDGFAMDVVEIDGASNRGIDEIRDLRENVRFAPTEGGYKVYIIDEVHMLTTDAFNALLKTLEEPPEYVVFVLATTEAHKVPQTIASRCQRFEFHNFTTEQVVARLQQVVKAEGLDVEPAALGLIGRHAGGGMRDALALLDQAVSFQDGPIEERHIAELLGVVPEEQIGRLLNHIAGSEGLAALTLLHEIISSGADVQQLTKDCITMLRELMLAKAGKEKAAAAAQGQTAGIKAEDWPNLNSLTMERTLSLIDLLAGALNDMRWVSPVWLPLEMAVIRSAEEESQGQAHPVKGPQAEAAEVSQLAERIQRLEKLVSELMARGGDAGLSADKEAGGLAESAGPRAGVEAGEPQPETPAASPRQPHAGRQEEFAALLAKWNDVSEMLRQERQAPVEAFLRESKPVGFDEDGRLLLVFPRAMEFHKVSLEQPRNRDVLERVLAQVVERPIEVVCHFEDEVPEAHDPSPKVEEEAAAEALGKADGAKAAKQAADDSVNPALDSALKIFGGMVQEVRHESERGWST